MWRHAIKTGAICVVDKTQKELADILGISEQRIKECEDKDYQCATFIEILDISEALGVEFKNASVQVDFEEIE